jgi:hypothetical protein
VSLLTIGENDRHDLVNLRRKLVLLMASNKSPSPLGSLRKRKTRFFLSFLLPR